MRNPIAYADLLLAPVFAVPGDKCALATDGAAVRVRIGEQGIARRT
ncbi:hypothetical protein [Georgenia deserti]|uniref:Uncharacterized protein n=1 Tax=Georgenia deserti TaxID=2093781 RepID=A0ABW4L2N9_9MICO